MATMNFSIPDDIKEAFNAVFEGENKSAVIARLMRTAIEHRKRQKNGDELLALSQRIRATGGGYSDDEISSARNEGRP